MKVTFWGVRGSFAVHGRPYLQFGGSTSCASLEINQNHLIIIDAGTGLRDLGRFLLSQKIRPKISLFITHFHLDHIIGLPSFQALYDPEIILHLYSPLKSHETLRLFDSLMGGRFFPVIFSKTPCRKEIHSIEERMEIEGIVIKAHHLPHPGGNLALRFEKDGKSLIFATDVEPLNEKWDEKMVAYAWKANYLIGEAMFTPEEYTQEKKGWGHSSWRVTLQLAQAASCENLIFSHWNPDYDDRKIKAIIAMAKKEFPRVFGARPGWKIEL
ncbi:MAG: MBL fold metallo-hydrolase [Candidatus Aminicenantes bacterium]|nr:MBL fold metallo-hydrolase [Candidatus Aminicenantes bacterium]